jgi:TusA-related sulfurtransferase
MRIAISGSHSLGKSTVVNDWVASRAGYTREEEPYRALGLHGPYEILFRDASTRLHNGIQLYYNISRVHRYASTCRQMTALQAHKEIDTRGLNCPLPILKAKKALADMSSGEVLKVLATDTGSLRDFQAFARQTGNELVQQDTVGAEFVHYLRRR